ncbi:MAG: hypothetical protein F6K47_36830 [Symploca sp. SIO2E6]|nr:hypothetical protein [Symploca sp. SIO2E6]
MFGVKISVVAPGQITRKPYATSDSELLTYYLLLITYYLLLITYSANPTYTLVAIRLRGRRLRGRREERRLQGRREL